MRQSRLARGQRVGQTVRRTRIAGNARGDVALDATTVITPAVTPNVPTNGDMPMMILSVR